MVAGTIVIRERSGATLPTAMTFPAPYGYEDYVATLDVSVLTSDDYSLIRGYLYYERPDSHPRSATRSP
jgi:hypothetical protein